MRKIFIFLFLLIILASLWYIFRSSSKEQEVTVGGLSFKCLEIKTLEEKFSNQLCEVKENSYGFCCEKDGFLYDCEKKIFSPGEFVQARVKFLEPEKLESYCFYSDIININHLMNGCDANITSLDLPEKRCIILSELPLVATGMSIQGFIPKTIGKIKILEVNITKDSISENFINLEVEVK